MEVDWVYYSSGSRDILDKVGQKGGRELIVLSRIVIMADGGAAFYDAGGIRYCVPAHRLYSWGWNK